jgi:hypothetical protein
LVSFVWLVQYTQKMVNNIIFSVLS